MTINMNNKIRHRRLYAFYNSKVLNVLYLLFVISLLQIGYMESMLMPLVCSAVILALFIGYALWLWIRKPKRIIINSWLSDLTIWFSIYFVAVAAMDAASWLWYAFPTVAAIVVCFINMIRPHDEPFDI